MNFLSPLKRAAVRARSFCNQRTPLNFTESQGVFTLGHAGEMPYFQVFNFGNLSAGA
jgi:hypothetical protein